MGELWYDPDGETEDCVPNCSACHREHGEAALRQLVAKRDDARWFWLIALSVALGEAGPDENTKWFAIKAV